MTLLLCMTLTGLALQCPACSAAGPGAATPILVSGPPLQGRQASVWWPGVPAAGNLGRDAGSQAQVPQQRWGKRPGEEPGEPAARNGRSCSAAGGHRSNGAHQAEQCQTLTHTHTCPHLHTLNHTYSGTSAHSQTHNRPHTSIHIPITPTHITHVHVTRSHTITLTDSHT